MVGTVEFFNPNNINSACTFAFTTAALDNAAFLYDNDFNTVLSSDGSADGVNEKWAIEFDSAHVIDSILLCNHNFKTGNVKYLDSSLVEQDFSPAIAWTANTTINDNFFAVTEVSACYGVVINVTNTIDAGEKSLGELRALDKFGELPRPKKFSPALNIEQDLKKKYDGGKDKIINGIKFEATVKFDDLSDANIDLLFELAQRGRAFYIYLSSLSAVKTKSFFKVCDMYFVNMTNDPKPKMPDELVDYVTWEADLKVEEV